MATDVGSWELGDVLAVAAFAVEHEAGTGERDRGGRYGRANRARSGSDTRTLG